MRIIVHFLLISFLFICCNTNDNKVRTFNNHDSTTISYQNIVTNSKCDSTFIKDLKNYFFKETGFKLQGSFYTDSAKIEDSLYILGVSLPNKVEKPSYKQKISSLMSFLMKSYKIKKEDKYITYDFYSDNVLKRIKEKYKEYKKKGYHVLILNGNLNSMTLLNNDLPSTKEGLSIIVFHELMHNYIDQKKYNIDIKYNEAICSVVGNYLALKYSIDTKNTDSTFIKKHILITENIYKCINDYTFKINYNIDNVNKLNNECQNEINSILDNSDSLQKVLFGGKVNNAYLLMYGEYSNKYFIIKNCYLKSCNTKESLTVLFNFQLNNRYYTSFL
ncbi:MAG: hypothetical protein HY951_10405 [Bacteroidia bacterium]|nr:hypothetical protein [Bacteroidia bacterium]